MYGHMKLLLENWRRYVREEVFYVSVEKLIPTEELGHGKGDEGYETSTAIDNKVSEIERGNFEPIEVCNQKPVNTYRMQDVEQAPKSGTAEPFYHVLDGHHRLEAARKLGLSKIPVYITNTESSVTYK
jgi:hypothetical protein